MKIILRAMLLIAAIAFSTVNANAYDYDFEYNGMYFKVTNLDPAECAITSGETKYKGNVVIPEAVKHKGKDVSVTAISGHAFYHCNALTSVSIPSSVKEIGYEAFDSCSYLSSASILNGVERIGDYAFNNCSRLTSVSIPNGVKDIGKAAFKGCSSITSVTIPSSVDRINGQAFYGCRRLDSVSIQNGVTDIGYEAFSECESLTSVSIPSSVTSIGDWSFGDCTNLTSVFIPNGVEDIGERAFSGCERLRSISIPSSVRYIGPYAIPSSIIKIEDSDSELYCRERPFISKKIEYLYIGRGLSWATFSIWDKIRTLVLGNKLTSLKLNYSYNDEFRNEKNDIDSVIISPSEHPISLDFLDLKERKRKIHCGYAYIGRETESGSQLYVSQQLTIDTDFTGKFNVDDTLQEIHSLKPKSVIRISLCHTAKRNPLIFPI